MSRAKADGKHSDLQKRRNSSPQWLTKVLMMQPFSCLAKAHRSLPHKGQQQEEEGNDRQDVHQGTESLISLRQLGQRGGVGSEAGQQRVRHGDPRARLRPITIFENYHACAAGDAGSQGAKSSAKQPSAIAWPMARVKRSRVVRLWRLSKVRPSISSQRIRWCR